MSTVRQPYTTKITATIPSVNMPYLSVRQNKLYDFIIVQGGTTTPPGAMFNGEEIPRTRIDLAAQKFFRGESDFLYFVGGGKRKIDAMKAYAVRIGVPSHKIIIDPDSAYTYQDAYHASKVAKKLGATNIAAVTNKEHVNTFRHALKKSLSDKNVDVFGVDSGISLPFELWRYGIEKFKLMEDLISSHGSKTPYEYYEKMRRSPLVKATRRMRQLYDNPLGVLRNLFVNV